MNGEQAQETETEMRNDTGAEERNGGIEESGKVDRIRDILFGSQMRDYEGRFQRLEERLGRESAESRADVQRRLEALENFLKGEVESLKNRLHAEQSERGNTSEKLGHDLGEAAKALELKIKYLDDHASREIHELREQQLEQAKALSAEIKEKHEQMQAGLNREAEQIRGAMTGREALAEMLSEIALRLKNEFRVPGA
jgi:DNA anti-recombination protein RmuC